MIFIYLVMIQMKIFSSLIFCILIVAIMCVHIHIKISKEFRSCEDYVNCDIQGCKKREKCIIVILVALAMMVALSAYELRSNHDEIEHMKIDATQKEFYGRLYRVMPKRKGVLIYLRDIRFAETGEKLKGMAKIFIYDNHTKGRNSNKYGNKKGYDNNFLENHKNIDKNLKTKEQYYGYQYIEKINNFKFNQIDKKASTRIWNLCDKYENNIGSVLRIPARLKLIEGSGNPGCFNSKIFFASRGIYYEAFANASDVYVEDEKEYKHNEVDSFSDAYPKLTLKPYWEMVCYNFNMHICKIRNSISKFFILYFEDDRLSLINSMIFGDSSLMNREVKEAYRKNQTAHILAVSGLHMGVILRLLSLLLKRLRMRCLHPIIYVFSIYYAALCFYSPSVIRAASTFIIGEIGSKYNRNIDGVTVTSAVLLIEMIARPQILYSTGMQLSYSMAFLLYTLTSFFAYSRRHIVRKLIPIFLSTMIVGLIFFGRISMLSPVANIITVFLGSIMVSIGIIILITILFILCISGLFSSISMESQIYETLFDIPLQTLWGLSYILDNINGFFSSIGESLTWEGIIPSTYMKLCLVLILLFCFSETMKISICRLDIKFILRSALICMLFLLSSFAIFDREYAFRSSPYIMLDVGQGDASYFNGDSLIERVLTGSDNNLIIDGGGEAKRDMAEEVHIPFLCWNMQKIIVAGLITHGDMDHSKGVEEIHEKGRMQKNLGELRMGDNISIGGGKIKVECLWPKRKNIKSTNDASSVYMVNVRGLKVLVTGDISQTVEREMISYYKALENRKNRLQGGGRKNQEIKSLRCHVLKVPHHGSKYSCSNDLILATKPLVAVIGVGENKYGHPNEGIIEKLKENDIIVYDTKSCGAIAVSRTGKGVKVWDMARSKKGLKPL